jgi:hypothetical protein
MIIKNRNSGLLRTLLSGLLLVIACFSCGKKQDSGGENGQVKEMAGGLPGGKAFEIDSLQSEVLWTLRKSDGSWLKGRFKPGKGYLLLEGNSLAAGFFEGDLWKNNTLTDSLNSPSLGSGKFLKDSLPVLFTPYGRKIRFDLKQTSRVIPRSEFRSIPSGDSLYPTHDIQFQAEIADSSQLLRLPLRLKLQAKQVSVSGSFQLNLREFGILSNQITAPGNIQWIPEAGLQFNLHFRESR